MLSVKEDLKKKGNKKNQFTYLVQCLHYLTTVVEARLQSHFEGNAFELNHPPTPDANDQSPLVQFVKHYHPSTEEMILILAALAPSVSAGFFDALIQRYLQGGGDFPEFGGAKGQSHRGTLPTGETVIFLLAGTDPQKRLYTLQLFDENCFLFKHKIVALQSVSMGEPFVSGKLIIEREFLDVFLTGQVKLPKLAMDFPAEHIETQMEWNDLVLNEYTMQQIREIEQWIHHHTVLMEEWEMNKKLKPGYRALFYGPPGTGKTLTATLLGKYTNRAVFRIDLSMVVSKYIGETEKNLASLFERAENKNWILFFDEADAIFGKRTGVRDAHDKYANQEVSYLLQRIESHTGLCILASNFKNNIDQAFMRRFNAMIYFPNPGYEEKIKLWKNAFPQKAPVVTGITFDRLAAQYELTGAQIMNIVQYTCLQSLAGQYDTISEMEIEQGIKRELAKEGK